ncbi:MAG TPA: hypothetical protein VE975_04395 [Actinomycetota bacterium]|nr:hypothetical protein [Actinomycetota bacterium]
MRESEVIPAVPGNEVEAVHASAVDGHETPEEVVSYVVGVDVGRPLEGDALPRVETAESGPFGPRETPEEVVEGAVLLDDHDDLLDGDALVGMRLSSRRLLLLEEKRLLQAGRGQQKGAAGNGQRGQNHRLDPAAPRRAWVPCLGTSSLRREGTGTAARGARERQSAWEALGSLALLDRSRGKIPQPGDLIDRVWEGNGIRAL